MNRINRNNIDDIAWLSSSLVCYALGLSTQSVLAEKRGSAAVCRARQMSMYLLHTSLGVSLALVARAFNRDRSTVAHACNAVENMREELTVDDLMDQLSSGLLAVVEVRDSMAA